MKNSTLYNLCVTKNWFTHGTSLQYRRMFDLNADGVLKLNKSEYALDSLARIIWICSDEIHSTTESKNLCWQPKMMKQHLLSPIPLMNLPVLLWKRHLWKRKKQNLIMKTCPGRHCWIITESLVADIMKKVFSYIIDTS